jgi:hypothetical protein
LPSKPENLIDQEPFVNIGKGIASYLKKSGNRIKIYTEKEEELDISFNELGVRIGTGLPYLRRLANRLDPFKNYMIRMCLAHLNRHH